MNGILDFSKTSHRGLGVNRPAEDGDVDWKLLVPSRCLRSRCRPRSVCALPLPHMPEDPRVGIFERDASSASVVSMGQGRRSTEFVRIIAGQIPPLLLSMRFPRHSRKGEPAECALAAGLPRHTNARSSKGAHLAFRWRHLVRSQGCRSGICRRRCHPAEIECFFVAHPVTAAFWSPSD
jgi:hypothetical protein